jgi:FkbM family methyltransferase
MLAPDPVKISIDLPENTYYIYMAACGGRDQIVSQISHDGWLSYEKPLPNLISRLVRSQRTSFLDIGANTGYYSLLAAVLGSVEVRAYEPVPQICEVMKCNIIHTFKTKFHPITVWSLALSNSNGKGELFVPDPSHGLIETSSSLNSGFKKIHAYNLQIDKTTIDSHLRAPRKIRIRTEQT